MIGILFFLALLPVIVAFLRGRGSLSMNAFWFAIFHLLTFSLVGYAFPGDGVSQATHFIVMATSLLCFYAFLIGFLLFSPNPRVLGPPVQVSELSAAIVSGDVRRAVVLLIVLTTVVGMIYFGGPPPVLDSLRSLLGGELSSDAAIAVRDFRFSMTKSAYFGGEYRGQGVLRAVTYVSSAIIVSYFSILMALKPGSYSRLKFILSLAFAFLFVGGVGDRAPFLEMLLIAAGAYSLAKPLKLKHVAVSALGAFLALLLLSALSTKGYHLLASQGLQGVSLLFDSLVERLFRGNSRYDIMIIELVNGGTWPLRWGDAHIRNLVTAIPGVNYGVPVSYELFIYTNPLSDRSTFLSGTYMTHAYLDFGWFGSPFVYAISGALIGFGSGVFEKRARRSSLFLLILPLVYFLLGKVFLYGIPGLIPYLIIVLALVLFLKALVSLSRRNRRVRNDALRFG